MSAGTLFSIILAVTGCILAIFFYMNDSLDKRIESAVSHPDFIKKVADQSRLPFLIFDVNGTFQSESGGATNLIDKVEPFKEENRFSGFVVYPKVFLKEPPIIQAINSDIPFSTPKRINTIDWQFRIPEFKGSVWKNAGKYDEPPANLFKLEIIR